jgi:hypothetical protein
LSFVLIRLARPHLYALVQRYGWIAFALLLCLLAAALPFAGKIADYGAEGWLWALFGLCQRLYVDSKLVSKSGEPRAQDAMRLLACLAAAIIYIWQEQQEYAFAQHPFTVFILGIAVLSLSLFLFIRGPSAVQPPRAIGGVLRFVGRHTLEIYAIQLAGSELLVKFVPGLAP